MSAVDDVFAYLETEGLAGGSTDWGLVRRRMSDGAQPDALVMVAEDGGQGPEQPAADGIGDAALADIGVLVTVRAGEWEGDASAAKAGAVLAALHGLRSTVVGATAYLRVRALTPEAIFAGFDDQGRPRHTIAFRLLAQIGGVPA